MKNKKADWDKVKHWSGCNEPLDERGECPKCSPKQTKVEQVAKEIVVFVQNNLGKSDDCMNFAKEEIKRYFIEKEKINNMINELRSIWKKQGYWANGGEIDTKEYLGRMFALDMIESKIKEEKGIEPETKEITRPSDKKCTICGSPCVWAMNHDRIEILQCTKHKNHRSIFGFTV